jgi:hypothetical protein
MSSSAGVAYWARTPPRLSTATRSPILIASSMSWVTKTIGLADLGLQAQELVLQALAVDRVDAPERLVHEHERRVGREGAGDADALAHAAGELAGVAPARLVGVERDELEELVDALARASLVPAEELGHRGDVVADRQVREEAGLLDRVADAAPQLRRGLVPDALPAEQDVPVGDVDHPVDHPHGGGLAAARGPDQDADLARRDGEREVLDDRGVGAWVALGNVPELQLDGLTRFAH